LPLVLHGILQPTSLLRQMIRAFQWDLARQVERLDWLLEQLPKYADWGYQELHLHLEDAVEYPSLPGVARTDAYTYKQFERLVGAATGVGINVVPIVNLLGHTQYLIKVPELCDLNELRSNDGSPLPEGQICPLHPRTLEIAERLLRDMAPFCTAGKVHVGLDESFHLGKHPLSKKEIDQIGLAAHFAGHVGRLHKITRGLGLRMGMWADMLCFIPEAIPLLPRELIAYDWYYFPFRRLPRVEMYNFKEYDLATPLQSHGIEYWGCPMNGSFRYEPLPLFGDRLGNIKSWWQRCGRVSAGGMLVTSWEPYRLALEMTTVVDAATASLWLDANLEDDAAMLAKGFERALGASPTKSRSLARAALECDRYPFAGYARWEINERWNVSSTRERSSDFRRGEVFYRRLSAQKLPVAFAASAKFMEYLHARDLFVREAAQGVLSLRRMQQKSSDISGQVAEMTERANRFGGQLRTGRQAARAMWLRTRQRHLSNANAVILTNDATRLRKWLRWLKRCQRSPQSVHEPSVMLGKWQLQLVIHNFAPALQKIVIEHHQSDGSWLELGSRFTLEFSSRAAAPKARFRRELSVSVNSINNEIPTVRIGVRGVGQVRISGVELRNGLVVRHPKNWSVNERRTLGHAAPQDGLPDLNWKTNADTLSVLWK